MTRSTFSRLLVCLSAVSLASCQEYDAGFSESQIKEAVYARNFVKTFGEIDSNQNWDLFGQTINGQSSHSRAASDIVVTDLGPETYALITREQSEGYQKMLPESDARDREYAATNLGRVTQDFVTRAKTIALYPVQWATNGNDKIGVYYYTTSDDTEATAVTDINGDTKYIVKKDVYWNKTHVYALNVFDAYSYTDQVSYFDGSYGYTGVTMFDLLKEAYPSKYYLDGSTKKVIANDGTEKTAANFYWDNQSEWKKDLEDCGRGFIADGTNSFKDASGNIIYAGCFVFSIGQTTSAPQPYTNSPLTDAFNSYNRLQSRPVQITIPASVGYVGFYIDNNGLVSYSESALNAKVTFSDKGEANASYVATYIDENIQDKNGNNVRYLCFEDWMAGATNFDLNDIVFRVYGMTEETIVDYENYSEDALLVCEDLGDLDFDFNDVVLKLSYFKGAEKTYHKTDGVVTSVESQESESLKVTAMAAGGANESTVTIHPVSGSGSDLTWGEIHTLLGGSAPSIINADETFGGEGQSKDLDISTYGGTWDKTKYPTYLSMLFDQGLIKIVSKGKDATAIVESNSYTESGQAPQMMLLPMSFEWPQETQPISEVYSGFNSWVADINATAWINSNNGKVTKR